MTTNKIPPKLRFSTQGTRGQNVIALQSGGVSCMDVWHTSGSSGDSGCLPGMGGGISGGTGKGC